MESVMPFCLCSILALPTSSKHSKSIYLEEISLLRDKVTELPGKVYCLSDSFFVEFISDIEIFTVL